MNDRLRLLLVAASVSGDCKVNKMLIYNSGKSRVFWKFNISKSMQVFYGGTETSGLQKQYLMIKFAKCLN